MTKLKAGRGRIPCLIIHLDVLSSCRTHADELSIEGSYRSVRQEPEMGQSSPSADLGSLSQLDGGMVRAKNSVTGHVCNSPGFIFVQSAEV